MANDLNTNEGTVLTIGFVIIGKIFTAINVTTLASISHVVAITVGLATLFINWPKIKDRIIELHKKFIK